MTEPDHSRPPVLSAIIPAAGLGTRFLPWSKAVPKEMLPVGNAPVVHHVVAEAVAAGISQIILVIAPGKEAICRYFDPDPELEEWLRSKKQSELLDSLRQLQETARFNYVYQAGMRGLGDAVRCGAATIAGQPFAVLLGDTIIQGQSPLPAMLSGWRQTGQGSVVVQPVSSRRAVGYGVCGGWETAPQVYHLDQMVEKPSPEAIPTMQLMDGRRVHMAFAARYVFPPELVSILEQIKPGRNQEIQLTDAMAELLLRCGFQAHLLEGTRMDIGTPAGLRAALIESEQV